MARVLGDDKKRASPNESLRSLFKQNGVRQERVDRIFSVYRFDLYPPVPFEPAETKCRHRSDQVLIDSERAITELHGRIQLQAVAIWSEPRPLRHQARVPLTLACRLKKRLEDKRLDQSAVT